MKKKNPFQWFDEFQPEMTRKDGVELYGKLIKEEQDEFMEALKDKDIVEMYDAIADILFVKAGYMHFKTINYPDFIKSYSIWIDKQDWINIYNKDCVLECLEEVTRSNFTKSKQLAKDGEKVGKVIKGDKYEAPNLKPILIKYGIIKDEKN